MLAQVNPVHAHPFSDLFGHPDALMQLNPCSEESEQQPPSSHQCPALFPLSHKESSPAGSLTNSTLQEQMDGSEAHHAEGNVDTRDHADRDSEEEAVPCNTKAFAVSTNKALTSKFRGVCWNKKNKRWQSAINSNGRYLYLGSYDSQEQAARVFDKAAVRVRGTRARINYSVSDYVDSQGAVLPDALVESLLLTACNPTKQRRHRKKQGDEPLSGSDDIATDKASAEIALQALARFVPNAQDGQGKPVILSSNPGSQGLHMGDGVSGGRSPTPQAASPQMPASPLHSASHILQIHNPVAHSSMGPGPAFVFCQQGRPNLELTEMSMHQHGMQARVSSGHAEPSASCNPLDQIKSRLPPEASLESLMMSDLPDLMGVLYREGGKYGAGIWNGSSLDKLGLYASAEDCRQACTATLRVITKMRPQPQTELRSLAHNASSSTPLPPAHVEQRQPGVSSINVLQHSQGSEMQVLSASEWGLQQLGGPHLRTFQIPAPGKQQHALMDFSHISGPGQPLGSPGRKYSLVNIDSLAVIPGLGSNLERSSLRGSDILVNHSNGQGLKSMKLQPLFLNSSNMAIGETCYVSDPPPHLISQRHPSSAHAHELKGDMGSRLPMGAAGSMAELREQHWTLPGCSLRQLANIDVNEALQLFIASKRSMNGSAP